MRWNVKEGLAVGTLVTVSVAAACTVEVNINTKPDQEPETPIVTGVPGASSGESAPRHVEPGPVPEAPTPPAIEGAPVAPPPPPVAGPEGDAVRDALFRFREEARTTPPPPPPPPELREAPTFTPFTKAPTILNRAEIISAMNERYPPLLRDAGIGGTVRVYFFIDADGSVQDVRLDQSSGHPALDDAALSVAAVYRFSPAQNRDERVPVWVSFPITFQR